MREFDNVNQLTVDVTSVPEVSGAGVVASLVEESYLSLDHATDVHPLRSVQVRGDGAAAA